MKNIVFKALLFPLRLLGVMCLYVFLIVFLLTGCGVQYVAPALSPLPAECGWNERGEITRGGGACEEFIRDYDALRGVK